MPGDAPELVRQLDSSLRSAEDLISDLLDISRLESGHMQAERKAFPLATLFDTLGCEFKALAQQQGMDFRLRSSNAWIDSDSKMLRRVLQNFLTNAFRYAQGRVLLGVRRDGDWLRLEVWDRGPGIAQDKLQVIFEEFKRLDSHQTRAEKGLGLGLAIADRLCKVLGHPLQVRSWPGKGSVFSVSVPLIRQPQPAAAPLVHEEPSQLPNDCQVLCIDNEDSILCGMHSDYINSNKYHHILTVEDPIEFVHESKKCLINQREVHRDTLVDQAFFRFVNEFDRVFDGENMVIFVTVYIVEHRRQCGRFTRAGRPSDQHQAPRHIGNFLENFAHAQIFHGQYLGGNGPKHRASTTILVEGVNPKARHAGDFEGEVGFEELLEVLTLFVVHDVVDQRVHLFVIQGR